MRFVTIGPARDRVRASAANDPPPPFSRGAYGCRGPMSADSERSNGYFRTGCFGGSRLPPPLRSDAAQHAAVRHTIKVDDIRLW